MCRESGEADAVVLDALAALVEHNLVRRDATPEGEPRLRRLETIREFALDELQASGEAEEIRRRQDFFRPNLVERDNVFDGLQRASTREHRQT